MNVFVDANILLQFYGLSPTELEELRKLTALGQDGHLTIWLPEQVVDEVARNREKVLAEATSPLRDSRLQIALPQLSIGFTERERLECSLRDTQRRHSELLKAIASATHARALGADIVLARLTEIAKIIPNDGDLIERARRRRELRQPPGKANSLGDAINWESLLMAIPAHEDIHLVSSDPDFSSPLDREQIGEYLADEWLRYNGGTAHLYRNLGLFSKTHFPAVDLATDVPKWRDIHALASSPNFAITHAVVARLASYDVFTPEQARMLSRAAAENSQVRWIASDIDVYGLLHRVITAHRERLDQGIVAVLEAEMHPSAPQAVSDEDALPF